MKTEACGAAFMTNLFWRIRGKLVGVALILVGIYLPLELTIVGRLLKNEKIRDADYPVLTAVRFVAELLRCPWGFWIYMFGLPVICLGLYAGGLCLILKKAPQLVIRTTAGGSVELK